MHYHHHHDAGAGVFGPITFGVGTLIAALPAGGPTGELAKLVGALAAAGGATASLLHWQQRRAVQRWRERMFDRLLSTPGVSPADLAVALGTPNSRKDDRP